MRRAGKNICMFGKNCLPKLATEIKLISTKSSPCNTQKPPHPPLQPTVLHSPNLAGFLHRYCPWVREKGLIWLVWTISLRSTSLLHWLKMEAGQLSLVSLIPFFLWPPSQYQVPDTHQQGTTEQTSNLSHHCSLCKQSPPHPLQFLLQNLSKSAGKLYSRGKVGWGNLKFTKNFSGKIYRWQAACGTIPENLQSWPLKVLRCWSTAYPMRPQVKPTFLLSDT